METIKLSKKMKVIDITQHNKGKERAMYIRNMNRQITESLTALGADLLNQGDMEAYEEFQAALCELLRLVGVSARGM